MEGMPCDAEGNDIATDAPPVPFDSDKTSRAGDWSPFASRPHFELADFIYRQSELSGAKIDDLMQIWAAMQAENDDNKSSSPPFPDHNSLYKAIDSIPHGESRWHSFKASYSGVIPDKDPPPWMVREYDVWFWDPQQVLRNQLSNQDFNQRFDYVPKQVFGEDDKRIWSDFMSGNWAWQQAVCLSHVAYSASE